MSRCSYCDKYCSSEGGLSNHLNACKTKKRKDKRRQEIDIYKLFESKFESKIKNITTRSHPVNVFNNCTFNFNTQYVINYKTQCDTFVSRIDETMNHPAAIQMLNSDDPIIMNECIKKLSNCVRLEGSEEDKHILEQLESDEVHIDQEFANDEVKNEIDNSLDDLDNRLTDVIVSKIKDPNLKEKWYSYIKNNNKSIFQITD